MASHGNAEARRAFARRFAENLHHARRAAGLSQEALGFEAMLHRTEVGTLERGERVPGLDTAVKLAAALGVSVDQLVEGIAWRVREPGGGKFDAPASADSHAD